MICLQIKKTRSKTRSKTRAQDELLVQVCKIEVSVPIVSW